MHRYWSWNSNHLFSVCLYHGLWASWGHFLMYYFVFCIKYGFWCMWSHWFTLRGCILANRPLLSSALLVSFTQIRWTFLNVLFPIMTLVSKLENCKKKKKKSYIRAKKTEELKNSLLGLPLVVQRLNIHLVMQGMLVWSLVRQLKSHMLQSN